jgi:enamine deaminase RidA (YjgF/YER057c/UK114 family)
MADVRHLTPDGLARPHGYSHVVVAPVESIVFVSGQVPLDAEGNLVGAGDVAAQARQVFQNLSIALEAAETSWSNVVKLNFFVRDVSEMPAVRTIRDEHVDTANPPASTLIEISRLFRDDVLIEVDAVAVR